MNPAFLELLSSCEPSTYDGSSFVGEGGGYVNTFAVNHLGDIMIIASDGRLKHSNIRSHPRHRTTTDQQGQRRQLEDVDLHGLLCDEVAGFTHLEYSSNSDLLMWSNTAAGVIVTNGVHHVHQKTDGLSSSFRYVKIWDKLQDNGELNGIIKATFHPLSPYHVVVLFDNNTLQLVDYRSMDIQVIPLSKRFSSGAFTSFSFGPNIDWLKFTMLFLTTNGDVYTLCPIIPLGAVVPMSAVMELWDGVDQLVVDDDGCNRSGNDRYYLQYIQRYLTDLFGERSSHGLVGEVSPTDDDDAIAEVMFVRAGESYENLHGDQLSISNYTPQLVGPIVIQRDSYEQLVGGDTGSNELKMSESLPHGTANDICVPGSPSNDTSLHPVGAPVVAISYSTGVVDVLVFDASQVNSVISSWSHISPTWRCIDINKPNVASSTAMHTSLLLAETIRVCPTVDVDDADHSFWTLLPDPVLHHSLHVTNFRRGVSYMISCYWLERIQEDISNEVSSSAGNTLRTYGHNNNNEEEESPVTGDPILDYPSKCVPVFILPSNAPPDKRQCSSGGGDVTNESKHGTNTLKNNNNSSSSSSMSREALIGMTVLCDALLGHVVLFRCASGFVSAINLTVHLRLSELQESLSRSRESSERLPIKEELSRAVSAEQIRWRHASECIRRVEEGLKGMPSSFEEAGSAYSLTPQSSSQNKKVLLEVAEKVERDVLIPINELAQSTAFSFQLLQEAYKSQAEVLEGSIDVDADSTSDGKPQGIGNDSLSIGLKNLIGRLNASHGELRGRVGLIQDAFDRQKASLEHLVAKAMQKRNKISSSNSDSILQLREWSTVIAKMNEQLTNLQSIAKSASTPTPTNRLTATGGMMYNPARSGLSTSASVASPFSQSPVTPLYGGSKIPLNSGMRMSSGVHHQLPSTRTPPPLNSVVARGSSSMSAVGLFTDPSRGLVSPMSVRSHTSSRLGLGGLTTPSSPYTHDSHQTHYTSRAVASPASNRPATASSAVTSNVTLQLTPSDQDICIQLLTSQTVLLEQAREELAILEERLHVLKESRDY